MKIFVEERGSCRGDSFSGDGSFESEEVLKLLANDDCDLEDEFAEKFGDDLFCTLIGCAIECPEEFEEVLKKGTGYICREESIIGFGTSSEKAKVQIIEAVDNDEWVI